MNLLPFLSQVPAIQLRDPLVQFLGATPDGVLEYSYIDAVKLCGHSCPTVAGAYVMVVKGLQALYPNATPERGNIEVAMRGGRAEGTVGVTATVAQLLTGAAAETGFAGIGAHGRFSRRDLLVFDADIAEELVLRRKDIGASVAVSFNGKIVPFAPEMREIMPLAVSGQATAEQLARFGELWQTRVKAILLDNWDNPELVLVKLL
ncbi:hypothetical protein QEO94_09985 [Kingella negevensis]|uniref:hypothetical protein n=1 Tax=Kingella negevensis TaxID=1522312 RepID=UPI002543CE4B|nr:hypothetical protein [Kingella negevensis]WII92945.1 hypothetical protein QEO94_09985 [Kingella negevensis]